MSGGWGTIRSLQHPAVRRSRWAQQPPSERRRSKLQLVAQTPQRYSEVMAEQTMIDPYASPPPLVLTMEEALSRGRENHKRLVAAGGSPVRNIEKRLAWKRSRGIDTTAEEQACGLRPKTPI